MVDLTIKIKGQLPCAQLVTFYVCLGLLLFTQLVNCQNECGIGTRDQSQQSVSRNQFFVLNTVDIATCNGSISSYRYCYYTPEESEMSPSSVIALYRRNSSIDSYDRVSEGVSVIIRSNDLAEQFTCSSITLRSPVTVQAGDMVAACVTVSRIQNSTLSIVGMGTNSSQYLMTADTIECNASTVSNLTKTSSLVLHVFADIEPDSSQPQPLGAGGTAAIVITVMLLVGVFAVVLTVLIVRKFKNKEVAILERTSSSERLFATQNLGAGFDNVGYYSYSDGISTTSRSRSTVKNTSIRSKPLTDSSQYDDVIVTARTLQYQAPEDSGQYDNIISSSSNNGGVNLSLLDSGKYEEVRTFSKPRIVPSPEVHPVESLDQQSSSHRHLYEFEYSRSLGRSFECSYADIDHYEPVNPAGTDYINPVESATITITQLLEMNKEEDIYSKVDPYQSPASIEEEIYLQLQSWGIASLSADDLEVKASIGSGQFGTVKKGTWNENNKSTPVALKSLKEGSSSSDKVKFLQEAAIMAQFRHPNIIMLYGVVTHSQPMMLVAELAAKGDLRKYLDSIRPEPGEIIAGDTLLTLLHFSQQVALGMQYLSAKGFVHRDLAARNILLSIKNVCKVADFGMSRDLADENYYISQGRDKIPVKWTAPEAIHYKKYSTASDVWAYGCLLYEIWSVGFKPFETKTNLQALRVLESGKRLPPPPGCPKKIYELMIMCWHPETSLRPGFRDIVLTLVGNEQMVLNIPEEDSSTNSLAGVLGAPLEAGENMYTDIQKRYIDLH